MSTETVLHCDAPLCTEEFAATTKTIRMARDRAKKRGWVEAHINRRLSDLCPSHSNLRTNQ